MKTLFNRFAILAAFLGLILVSTAFTPATKTITVVNKCSFAINEIYISEVDDQKWGNDILNSDEVLKPEASVEIEIDCGQWDVKLVAPDGSTCEVRNVDICAADTWEVHADCAAE